MILGERDGEARNKRTGSKRVGAASPVREWNKKHATLQSVPWWEWLVVFLSNFSFFRRPIHPEMRKSERSRSRSG
jgi:hypothetical protein